MIIPLTEILSVKNTGSFTEMCIRDSNRSDSKATVEVNAGTIKESAYTTKSIAQNYVASDQKHAGGNEASYMQRVYVPFTAEKETATLTISRAAGDGATYFDEDVYKRQGEKIPK